MVALALGVLLAQIMNVLIRWWEHRSKEYLLYLLYLITFFTYVGILFIDKFWPGEITPALERFVKETTRPHALVIYFVYNQFIIAFLDLKITNRPFYRVMRLYNWIIVSAFFNQMIVQYYLGTDPRAQRYIYGFFVFGIFLFTLYNIYRLWKDRTALTAYILKGSLCLILGTFVTNVLNSLITAGKIEMGEAYFYPVLLGIGLEIYFFNSGLFFKTRNDEKELIRTQQLLINEMQENEQLLVDRQNMRNKIAQDLHDDVGATLSGIALHSHLSSVNMEKQNAPAVLQSLKLIQDSATQMVTRLNDIVWAVNPVHDELDKIIQRLEEYAVSMAAAKEIEVTVKKDPQLGKLKLPMEIRKNVYLVGKEAINNAVKYAEAEHIDIRAEKEDGDIRLTITDNGKGFDRETCKAGNGLINMQQRANEVKALLEIRSAPGKGTCVCITCKIPH